MKASQEFNSFLDSEVLTLWIKLPKKHFWNKRKKFRFRLKPLVPEDLVSLGELKSRIEELTKKGITQDKALGRIAMETKDKLLNMNWEETAILLLEKSSISPKIVPKSEGLKDDEISFSKIPDNIKRILIENIQKISPIFGGKIA